MEVNCGKCAATYQFDATVIPVEGYDAQCTSCGEVFFVKPPVVADANTAAPEPGHDKAPASDISVTCQKCGAVYQFSPDDIPQQGYDAQCTECDTVFFVSPQGRALVIDGPAPVQLTPKGTLAPATAPEPVSLQPTSPEPPPSAPRDEADLSLSGFASESTPGQSDLMAIHTELGEPLEPPDGFSMEEDFEDILRRRRRRTMIGLGLGIAIPLATALLYVGAPGTFDSTIGPLIGVKAQIHPAAVPIMEQGLTLMLQDTEEGYKEAIDKFGEALAIDPQYPDALALLALSHAFLGHDIQGRGIAIRQDAADSVTELQTLRHLPPKKRPKGAEDHMAQLTAKAQELGEQSTRLYELGGDQFVQAQTHLQRGLEEFTDSPMVLAASGIFLVGRDPDRVVDAAKRFRRSLQLLGVGDSAAPPDSWTAFLKGAMAASGNDDDPARYFEAALEKEPRFQRARYQLAMSLRKAGNDAQARSVAEEIITKVPDHQKAAGFLNGSTVAPSDQRQGAYKNKGKGKRRSKRKRRRKQ